MTRLWYEREKAKDYRAKAAGPISFVDAKLDGWLLDIAVTPNGQQIAMTRRDDVWYKLKHLQWPWHICKHLEPGTAVQGELYVPGRPASDVPKMLCADVHQLQFAAFAIPSWRGTSEGLTDMDPMIVEAMLKTWQCKVVPRIAYDAAWGVTGALEVMRSGIAAGQYSVAKGYAMVTAADVEGVVLKERHYGGWWKYKESRLVDLVVMGIKDGQGKNMGAAGALLGGVWKMKYYCEPCQRWQENELRPCDECGRDLTPAPELIEVASVSGMDDDTRDNITEDDIGRVFEAEYQYLGSGNRLRHPRFKRWRDDKPQEECTWQQVLR